MKKVWKKSNSSHNYNRQESNSRDEQYRIYCNSCGCSCGENVYRGSYYCDNCYNYNCLNEMM